MLNLLHLSNDNPNAACFLKLIKQLLDRGNKRAGFIAKKILDCNLSGTALVVLYHDLCNGNIAKTVKLCQNCPNDILIDACSRQDYSGVDLIKPYLE